MPISKQAKLMKIGRYNQRHIAACERKDYERADYWLKKIEEIEKK